MKYPCVGLMTLLVATATLAVVAPPQIMELAPTARRFGEVVREPGAYLGIGLPEAISLHEVARWAQALELDDARAAVLVTAVEAFYEARQSDVEAILEPAYRMSAELAFSDGKHLHERSDAPEAYREMLRVRSKAVSRLNALEESMFVLVAEAVAADPIDGTADVAMMANTIRQLRRRTRYASLPVRLPRAGVDLRGLALELDAAIPFSVVDRDAWRTAWQSHDAELAALEDRRVTRSLEMSLEDYEITRASGGDGQAILEHRTERMRRSNAIDQSIIAANARWAEVFAGMLAPQDAHRWRQAVRAANYPSLYPNPVALDALVEGLRVAEETEAAPEDLRSVRESIAGESAQVAAAEAEMESLLDALALSESRHVTIPQLQAEFDERVQAFRTCRCSAAARALALCEPVQWARDLPEAQALAVAVDTVCGGPEPRHEGVERKNEPRTQ